MALPKLDFALNLSHRQRLAAKIVGFTLLAIVSFLFTLHLVFPYERLRGKLIEVLSSKYDVSIAEVGRGWLPGQIVLEKIVLKSRPTTPDEKPTEIVIDRLEIDLGLDFNMIGALRKKVAVDFEAELGDGEIEGELDWSKSMVEVALATEALQLETVPGLATAVGLPMTGALDTEVELRLPGGAWKDAEGKIDLDCIGCTVGDGVAKLSFKPRRARRGRTAGWDADARSITVPRLALGEASAEIDISKGVGEIKQFAATSSDGWLKITGRIEFKDPFSDSLFPGCMQFKLSDELKKREPNFGNIEYGISEKLRQADGSYSIPTTGKLTALRWDPRKRCGGGAADDEEEEEGEPGRPSIAGRPTLTPELPEAPAGDGRVDPASVPGVSGAPEGTEVPAPGTSGPALGTSSPQESEAKPEGELQQDDPGMVRDRGEDPPEGGEDGEPEGGRDDRGDEDPEDRDGRGPEVDQEDGDQVDVVD